MNENENENAAASLLPVDATPVGPVREAKPLGGLRLNRQARRKAAAFERSAKWRRMFEAGHKAAVRKLNRLAEKRRADLSKFGSPED